MENGHNASPFCFENNQLECRKRSSQCFHLNDICVYRNDRINLIPCEHKEHLQRCSKIECNTWFQCPGYYCIPWKYVCDGKWDCPRGYESKENNCGITRSCSYMFKCRNHQVCIHLSERCDSKNDCPLGDDEYSCSLNENICPNLCQCSLFAIQCYNMRILSGSLQSISFYNVILISYCNI